MQTGATARPPAIGESLRGTRKEQQGRRELEDATAPTRASQDRLTRKGEDNTELLQLKP